LGKTKKTKKKKKKKEKRGKYCRKTKTKEKTL
jgi:hypothetical protein